MKSIKRLAVLGAAGCLVIVGLTAPASAEDPCVTVDGDAVVCAGQEQSPGTAQNYTVTNDGRITVCVTTQCETVETDLAPTGVGEPGTPPAPPTVSPGSTQPVGPYVPEVCVASICEGGGYLFYPVTITPGDDICRYAHATTVYVNGIPLQPNPENCDLGPD